MAKLNKWQKYLDDYIQRYQDLVSEIYYSIIDYRAGCGNLRLITTKEKDFLLIQFYPSLQINLYHFISCDRAEILQKIIRNAHNVLSPLTNVDSFEKYKDDLIFEQDIEGTLRSALYATKEILEVQTEKSKQTVSSSGTVNNESKEKSKKEPSKKAAQAYQLYYGTGKTQTEVAKIMTLKFREPVSQGQVSRWVNSYKEWRKSEGILIDDKKPKIIVNSDILDKGPRTDGRITGDPRHKKH